MTARLRLRLPTRLLVSLPLLLLLGAVLSGSASSGTTSATAPQHSPQAPFGAGGSQITAGPTRGTAVIPTLLHFNGNPPEDVGCGGVGNTDVVMDTCSDLRLPAARTPGSGPAARWTPAAALNQPALDRSQVDPNWIWVLTSETIIEGDMTVKWWASVNASALVFGMAWRFQIWADGALAFTTPVGGVDATPSMAHVPELLTATITLPNIAATTKLVLKLDTEFADTGQGAVIYYDSVMPCPGAATGTCDSTVTMPVVGPTAVQLEHFRAHADRGRIILRWRTASETEVLGFNVWRRAAGVERKVNRELVAASGRASGASYRLVDRSARPAKTYSYRLQVVRRDGSTSWLGPTQVRLAR